MSSRMRTGKPSQQPRRLLMALAILLVALIALLVKDRQFWFGAEQANIESDMPEATVTSETTGRTPVRTARGTSATQPRRATVSKISADSSTNPAIVTTTRSTLRPLGVQVVAKDANRKTIEDIQNTANSNDAIETPTNAAEREQLAAATAQPEVNASYPLLAQHMNVQGSVVLQAIISTTGIVEELRVLSGPAILATAAQQAVREWRFKPVVQNGQAVETKARITVNFSIKVADNSATTTIAESRASDVLTITR
jgi:TonB family protein